MFMPEESHTAPGGGSIFGHVARPPQVVVEPGGLFSRPRSVTMFRLRSDEGREVNCVLPAMLSGTLDLGDRIEIWGYLHRGVLQVTRIHDEDGAEIARVGCFVVTAACGSQQSPDVLTLRQFRDEVLLTTRWGSVAVAVYGRIGPRLARTIAGRPLFCSLVRALLIRPLRILAEDALRARQRR